jgi:hypothetical protein
VFNRNVKPNFLQVIHMTASSIHMWSYILPPERGGEGAPESNILAGGESRPRLGNPPARTGWKPTKEKRKHLRNPIMHNIS